MKKILSEGFISFSIFGIACIFGGGGLIVLLSFMLDPILSWCLDRSGRHRYAKLEWSTNETIQLQRMAHEGSGMGTWSRGTNSIPVTKPGDVLAVLDITNPTHPVLRAYGVNDCQLTGEFADGSLDGEEKIVDSSEVD